ncbi:MAG: hypothetical protein A2719_04875 [Candidatus Ryanbacteria bacterium RIFCSPHIGHO2_01_FULL_45_22]|uniref:Nudix hydrolase domain-containing protein n=1 Tax=Candidatus Ryanbacteria bacterium RIFCSPHIGHO2_01_FULL_45_22 TaxID=1802114 RepID=A0A1G2G232_9BACT|nr:MAG: hypothetical protein A2719_04875 [Candidatus Ryanbacteria bacterium RIFCSPHIGHO2_01_FULL_45_22]
MEENKQNHIELIARAVVIDNNAILLCRPKAGDYYYFPGGHVDFDEDSVTALKRELKEEADVDVSETRFIGVWENSFFQNSFHKQPEQKHELNLLFEAKLASSDIKNMEDHIESGWVSLEEFKKARVLPVLLKEKIIQWMKDKEMFFGSEKDGTRIA